MIARFRVLDEQKNALAPEGEGDVSTLDQTVSASGGWASVSHALMLTRPGRFFLRMNVEDSYAGKQVTYDIPFAVYPVP